MKYVALLRGIGPGDPNMRNEKLCGVMESLGFTGVRSVISSGNIIFESNETNTQVLEVKIEAAWPEMLEFYSTTIIRSKEELADIAAQNPFSGMTHGPESYLLVTFFKKPTKVPFELPYQPPGKTYRLLAANRHTLFTTTDNTKVKTTDLMTWMEKQFGKEISSRTFATIQLILKKMQ